MSTRTISTRRSFLKGGAIAAAPLAVALPPAALAADARAARLQRLEDEAAIAALQRDWLRSVNAGDGVGAAALFADPRAARLDKAVRSIAPAGEDERLEIAPDGLSAVARHAVTVETVSELERSCTLAQMAHAQGMGTVRATAPRVLHARYVKVGDGWVIERIELAAA